MDAFDCVRCEVRDGIAWLTLDRPHKANAYSVRMRDELHELLDALRAVDEVHVIVIRGAGDKGFCGGADLSEFLTAPSVLQARRIRALRDLWTLLRTMPQPTIAALHGHVLGSGVEIAMFCDLRIAADDVVIGLPEMSLGILPGAGGTQTVPRSIGLAHALDLLLTDRRLDADEALAAGLVTRCVPRAALADTVESLARRLAGFEPAVLRAAKRALHEGADLPLPQALRLEARLAAVHAT
jgi:enoyl-CoA hydratase